MTRQNQLIAGAALVVVIILGLGGYLVFGKNQMKPATTAVVNKPQASNSGSNTIQSSITDLFTSGATKQCTFDVTSTSGGTTKGTIDVSGNKAYGSFTTTASGKTTTTNLIRNDTTFYIWGDSLPTGIKMTMNVTDMATKMQGSQSSINPNEKVNYNCVPWSVDNSKFTPPASIKFTDTSALIPQTTTAPGAKTQTGTTDPCASITNASAKTACENAMHQNGY